MYGKTPLKETKQTSLAVTKGQFQGLKETYKPTKSPSVIQIKKENVPTPQIKTGKLPEKKENLSKSPLNKKEAPTKSISILRVEQNKPKPASSMMMAEVKQDLHPCKECGRTFVETALKRHEKICKKIFINKRKEFNSAKQRFASKDQLTLFKRNKDKPDPVIQNKRVSPMPLWKQQSLAFRLAMKQMKGAKKTQEELEYLQKEKKIIKSSMFKCKFCGRSFNEESGKRHEGFCAQKAKDMMNKGKKK